MIPPRGCVFSTTLTLYPPRPYTLCSCRRARQGGDHMARLAHDVVRAAVRLPAQERVRLVEEVLVSLESEKDRHADAAWAAEIEPRARQLPEGEVRPIPWSKVPARVRTRVLAQTQLP